MLTCRMQHEVILAALAYDRAYHNLEPCLQALDKAFIPDITSAYRDVPMDGDVLNRVRHSAPHL